MTDNRQRVTAPWKIVTITLTIVGIFLTMNQVFYWNPAGFALLQNTYLYMLLACFLPIVFIVFPIAKSVNTRGVPLYDIALSAASLTTCLYFSFHGETIVTFGWDYAAPTMATVFSFLLWVLVLDALRRTAGLIVTAIALCLSLYPLIAEQVPVAFMRGITFDVTATARMHAMGVESILGLPLQTAGSILVGFLLFGVALQHTGGATFFYDLAQSLFGRFRGGSAKVSVVSSGFMGMMSGSAISNVLTTGPMTIPAMKRSGFPARYAGGVEATASTGGTVTPPVMGTAAFLMVSFLGVPYGEIALAAAIPAFLYFFGAFVQIDAFSGKNGFVGMERDQLPRLISTLVRGTPYVIALIGLILLLVVMQNESRAPFYIVGLLLLISLFSGAHRLTVKSFFEFIYDSGKTIAEVIGIIAGVGLVVGGLSMTGVSLSLARELVSAVGENLLLILLAGAVTSFILGMGMTVSAVYVFLAIIMAPALTQLGVNPIAAHLFVIYWATVSYITPPVALAAFAAASISKASPMSTAWVAMRLGSVKYLIPFAFVYNPALVGQESTLLEISYTFVFAVIGVFYLGCSFEGWMIGSNRRLNTTLRILLAVAGLLAFVPELTSSAIGLVLGIAVVIASRFWNPGGNGTSASDVGARSPSGFKDKQADSLSAANTSGSSTEPESKASSG